MARSNRKHAGEEAYRSAIYNLLQVSALMLKTREYFAAAVGVTPPQFSILMAVSERPGTSVGEVAGRLHVSGPFVTGEVSKLVRAGMIEKKSSATDRRVAELRVTKNCAAKLAGVSPLREASNQKVFAHMSADELASFSRELETLIGGLEDALHMLSRPPQGL